MKMYKTTRAIKIVSGAIKLDEKQADARKHLLIATGDKDVFLPAGELSFKVGEVIGLGQVSKAMAMDLEPLAVEKSEGKKK